MKIVDENGVEMIPRSFLEDRIRLAEMIELQYEANFLRGCLEFWDLIPEMETHESDIGD